ncbi:magnesium-transporting ATPase (P-type) [Mesonia hippocampi]|uniref:Magnesium-transporting ATPase (P-type) n=1 Tax=Mesonia hippocampi TaxID=1628250 RepID=A0A840EK35_9FLAO|nr:hypothetical protein [Mesonia hippocampi]MBB4118739.1 magnesium-transporting ATPase (P-type) [Mesonia hippocampi]
MSLQQLTEKIEKAPELDFGSIFNDSIELFKKVWVPGFVTILLTLLLMLPFYIVMYLPLITMGVMDPEMLEYGGSAVSMGTMIFTYGMMLVFLVAVCYISLALQAAFYRICKYKDLGIEGKEDYFYFFKKQYFKRTLVLGLMTSLIAMLATMLCMLPVFYVIVPLSFMPMFLALKPELEWKDNLKASFALGNKKWLITFGLIMVSGILAQFVGMLACGIGVLFTAAFGKLPVYFIYKKVIGIEEEETSEIDEIGKLEL